MGSPPEYKHIGRSRACKRPAHPSSCRPVLTSSRIISCHPREFLNIMRCGLHWSRPLRPRGRWMVDVRLGWSESQHQDWGSGFCGAVSAGSKTPGAPLSFCCIPRRHAASSGRARGRTGLLPFWNAAIVRSRWFGLGSGTPEEASPRGPTNVEERKECCCEREGYS